MSNIVYEEDIIYDIRDYFKTNLGGYLTSIAALKDDGIALQDIKKYIIGNKDIFTIQSIPAAVLYPGELLYVPNSLGSDVFKIQIMLSVIIKAGTTENLIFKALRYVSAIRQCIDADRTAGEKVDRARIAQINFYASPPGQENSIVIESVIEAEKEIPRG